MMYLVMKKIFHLLLVFDFVLLFLALLLVLLMPFLLILLLLRLLLLLILLFIFLLLSLLFLTPERPAVTGFEHLGLDVMSNRQFSESENSEFVVPNVQVS
jgi:hypothetical protein